MTAMELLMVMLYIFLQQTHATGPCRSFMYYNLEFLECKPCQICLPFEFLVAECTKFNDSICINITNETQLRKYKVLSMIGFKFPGKEVNNGMQTVTVPVPNTKMDVANWKTLSYALTAVLCLLAVMSGLVLLYLWKHRWKVKSYYGLQTRQGEDTELGNEYVVFHRRVQPDSSYDVEEDVGVLLPRPPVRGCRVIDINVRKYSRYYRKRFYKPQRRLLSEGVDDVFESEDSAGSRSIRLQTIPERSDSDIEDVLNAEESVKKSDNQHKIMFNQIDINVNKEYSFLSENNLPEIEISRSSSQLDHKNNSEIEENGGSSASLKETCNRDTDNS